MKKNKAVIITSILAILLIVTMGVTFAIFSYTKAGGNQQLVLGDIYMHYKETNQIVIENAMPSNSYDENNYFEFTIDGKNTYEKKDIWYEIVLSHGENHETRTTRLLDKFLKFRLVEIKDGVETVVLDNKSYSDLTNKRIWVNTIPKNTTNEILITYRLYMWISNATLIGNTSESDYDIDTWNNHVFASIKVGVSGDFNEKDMSASLVETIKETYGSEGGVVAVNQEGTLYDPKDTTQTIREYRYSGKTVNNYVTFNNETWRIIGVFKETLEDGTEEEYVKMIFARQVPNFDFSNPSTYIKNGTTYTLLEGEQVLWNKPDTLKSTNYTDWTTAGLQYYLNTEQDDSETPKAGFLSHLSEGAKNLIRTTTYYLGNVSLSKTAIETYEEERDASNILSGNQATWKGKVALPYPSDFGYAMDNNYWNTDMFTRGASSWIIGNSWCLSPYSSDTAITRYASIFDYPVYGDPTDYSVRVIPVISLKADTVTISGSGSESFPYILRES